MQMVVYREDFNEERKAREAMAGEKYQLEEALKTKAEEIRGLKRQLNEQAAMAMQTDVSNCTPLHCTQAVFFPIEQDGSSIRKEMAWERV